MADAIYTVVLDLTDDGCIETGWRLKQGDSGLSKIVAKIVSNGVDVYEPDATPEIAFKRADGNSVLSTMVANDGYYEYTFVGNEISVVGRVVMDVTFTDLEDRISTCSARFEVVENPAGYDPEGAHTYDNPVSQLVALATEDSLIAEGFAVGQQRGQDVQESSPYYHNNAKYYSDLTDPTALRNMSDVDVDGIQNGQILKWNSTAQKFENANESGGGVVIDDTTTALDKVWSSSKTNTEITSAVATKENAPTILTSTLSAGSTSLTFSNEAITTTAMYDVYADKYGLTPTDITVTTGQAVLTFEAQSSNVSVKLVIR